jgi:hypothetical protein
LLASATLPGVFPPVRIQVRVGGQSYDELHVDGGVTRQVFIAPSIFRVVSHGQKGRPAASPHLYVIRNGKIDPEWLSVSENVVSITQRSISTLIKNQAIGDLYRIYMIQDAGWIGGQQRWSCHLSCSRLHDGRLGPRQPGNSSCR